MQSTTSLPITPLRVQLVSVVLVVPSYGLSATVTVGMRLAAVIAAMVVAVVVANV